MKKSLYKDAIHFYVPLLLCSLLFFTSADNMICSLFQRLLSPLKENNQILLVNVDDTAIEHIGTFPWTRDIVADELLSLRESGAEAVVFDMSYFNQSPLKTTREYLAETAPHKIQQEFTALHSSLEILLDSLYDGTLQKEDIPEAKDVFSDIVNQTENHVSSIVHAGALDTDEYFSQALHSAGNAYIAFALLPYAVESTEEKAATLSVYEASKDTITPEFFGAQLPIENVLHNAASAGFVNSDADEDGHRRRIHLVAKYNGNYYGQLVFVSLLHYLGNPQIEITNAYIKLINVVDPAGKHTEILIPRAKDGSVLLRWPQNRFENYNAISAWEIQKRIELERIIVSNLFLMKDNGFFAFSHNGTALFDIYDKTIFSGQPLAEYAQAKNDFFAEAERFANSSCKDEILRTVQGDAEKTEYVCNLFETVCSQLRLLNEITAHHRKRLDGAVCIIGTTATSTTDYGLTIYGHTDPNVGIHYVLANMILNEDFITDSSRWISFLFALSLVLGISFTLKKISKSKSVLAGIVFVLLSLLIPLAVFLTAKIYIGAAVPFCTLFVIFVFTNLSNFLTTLKEKSFIHSAFSHYLSDEVIKQIIENPAKLSLGGDKCELTAIFTDIRGFSSISEKLAPEKLVNLLNTYLTAMCNIILANKGTIDKFEGDAIIAFFGAPVPCQNHAVQACLSAVHMKKAEAALNKKLLKTQECPVPLFTRIGIHTGDMVVGNMGTKNKMNYTIMGNNVNLASRLEGINKQYETKGILCSEETWLHTEGCFLGRRLDKVRVVGIQAPIRLYEIFDELTAASEEEKAYVATWEEALTLFENSTFAQAEEKFSALLKQHSDDHTAQLYVKRCREYAQTPPEENWDAVVTLNQK